MRFARHFLSTALLALALSACATPPKQAMTAPSAEAAAGLAEEFAGAWFVTAVFPTGAAHGNGGDRHIGVAILVKGDDVSDVNGHRCGAPDFTASHVTAAVAGLKMAAPADIDRLQIDCAGKPFAILLQVPGRSLATLGVPARNMTGSGSALLDGTAPVLIAQRPEGLYLLERAEQVLYRQADMGPVLSLDATTRGNARAPAAAKPKPPAKLQPVASLATPKPAASSTLVADAKISKSATAKIITSTAAPGTTAKKPVASKPAAKPTATSQVASSAKSMPKAQPAIPSRNMMALVGSDVSGMKQHKPAKPTAMGSIASAPQEPVRTAAVKPIAVAPKGGEAIHLASYAGLDAAVHGWASLRQQYAELAPLKPLYVSSDGTGKAATIRLFAAGAAPDKLRQICSDLQSRQAYCTLNP